MPKQKCPTLAVLKAVAWGDVLSGHDLEKMADIAAEVEFHADSCPLCTHRLQELRASSEALRTLVSNPDLFPVDGPEPDEVLVPPDVALHLLELELGPATWDFDGDGEGIGSDFASSDAID